MEDGTIQLLFRQLRSFQSPTIPLPDLCGIETELQTYISKLKLEMKNTREDCQSQVDIVQKSTGNLRSTLSRFEDMSSLLGGVAPVSIVGSMNCQQSGCFFRSDKPDELQKHTETGLHCRLQLQNFVVIHGTAIEAVSTPGPVASDMDSHQAVIAEHVNTSMESSAIPHGAKLPGASLELQTMVHSARGKFRSFQPFPTVSITMLTDIEPETNPDQHQHHQHPNQYDKSKLLPRQDTDLKGERLGSEDVARFKCHHCSKRFTRSHTLAEHGRTHKGERPFGCNKCTKRFTRLKDRNRHQLLHSGERPFICKGTSDTGKQLGCLSRFAREDGLLSHLRSESAFQCLEPLLNIAAEHIFSLTNKVGGERQYCPNPPNGCGLRFQHLKDFKDHFDSEAGKACVKSRLLAFALPYFDHRRVDGKTRQTSTLPSPVHGEAPHLHPIEASPVPHLSSFADRASPVSASTHSKASDSTIPRVVVAETFDFAAGDFDLAPRKLPQDLYSDRGISTLQHPTSASESSLSNELFGPLESVQGICGIGLRIEGYTPTRGTAGDLLQIEIESFVPLLCAVFSTQIGFFVEPEPRLQNMNAVFATVGEERMSPASFYRYKVSARVPFPGSQPRMSPLPIILEINGLQRYGGKMFEFLEAGHFTYEEAHERAEMIS
jgi:hypothetical protein